MSAAAVLRSTGQTMRDYPLEMLRGKIGMVPQQTELFSGTIAENIRWGKCRRL